MTEQNEKIINSSVKMLTISEDESGQRIDNYLLAKLKGVPKSLIYRIVRKGEVRVNKGRIKPEYKLQTGDIVRVPPVRVAEKNGPLDAVLAMLQSHQNLNHFHHAQRFLKVYLKQSNNHLQIKFGFQVRRLY